MGGAWHQCWCFLYLVSFVETSLAKERRHQVNSRTVIQGIARNDEENNSNQTILVDIGIEKILTSRIRKGDGVVVDHQGIQTHGEVTEIGSTVTKITLERPLSFPHPSKIS